MERNNISTDIITKLNESNIIEQKKEIIDEILGPLYSQGITVSIDDHYRNTFGTQFFYKYKNFLWLPINVDVESREIYLSEPEKFITQATIRTTNGAIVYTAREIYSSGFTYQPKFYEAPGKEVKDSYKLYGHTLAEIKQQPKIFEYIDKIHNEYIDKNNNKEVKKSQIKNLDTRDLHDISIVINKLKKYNYTESSLLDFINRCLSVSYNLYGTNLNRGTFKNITECFKDLMLKGYSSFEDIDLFNKTLTKYFGKNNVDTEYSSNGEYTVDDDKYPVLERFCGSRVANKFVTYLTSWIKANPGSTTFAKEFIDNLFNINEGGK